MSAADEARRLLERMRDREAQVRADREAAEAARRAAEQERKR